MKLKFFFVLFSLSLAVNAYSLDIEFSCKAHINELRNLNNDISETYKKIADIEADFNSKKLTYLFCKNEISDRCGIAFDELSSSIQKYHKFHSGLISDLRRVKDVIKFLDETCDKSLRTLRDEMSDTFGSRFTKRK